MRRRTKIAISIAVAVLLLLLGGVLYLRKTEPPEVARLLPEADGIVYLNLKPLREATHFDEHPITHAPDYQHFIDATGIHPERDLDQVAVALERMPDPNGPNGPVAYSEVFKGRFDPQRLADYLKSIAQDTKTYADRTIYEIPSQGRTVRVALLGKDMVAVSNTPTSEAIHSIVDHYRRSALLFTGSSLLAARYSEVPVLSPVWGIGKIGLPLSDGTGSIQALGVSLPFSPDTTFVASLRWTGKTKLRVEQIAPTEEAAASSAEAMGNLLSFARTLEEAAPSDAAHAKLKAGMLTMLNSARVRHEKDRMVFTATIPAELLRQLTKAPVNMPAGSGPQSVPDPKAAPSPQKSQRK